MKRSLIVMSVVALIVSSIAVMAEDAKETVLKGKLAKAEKEGAVTYTLATADGDVVLPAPQPEQEGEKVINLDEFVEANVEVKALAVCLEEEGKKTTTVKKVLHVKKVEEEK